MVAEKDSSVTTLKYAEHFFHKQPESGRLGVEVFGRDSTVALMLQIAAKHHRRQIAFCILKLEN